MYLNISITEPGHLKSLRDFRCGLSPHIASQNVSSSCEHGKRPFACLCPAHYNTKKRDLFVSRLTTITQWQAFVNEKFLFDFSRLREALLEQKSFISDLLPRRSFENCLCGDTRKSLCANLFLCQLLAFAGDGL